MGCGSSRSSRVIEIDPNKPPPAPKPKPKSADSILSRTRKKLRPESGASAVTASKIQVRQSGSASSHKSIDSGIGNESRQESAKKRFVPLITNHAKELPKISGTVERPPLTIGAINRPVKADSEKILESLRQEGLLEAPETSTAKGGLRYELPADELITKSRPPPRLNRIRRPSKDLEAMKQQLTEKLENAEKRRKQREQDKVEKNRDKDARNLEVKLALLDFERSKENESREQLDKNIESHVNKRASRLQSIIEKQQEKDRLKNL